MQMPTYLDYQILPDYNVTPWKSETITVTVIATLLSPKQNNVGSFFISDKAEITII